MPRYSREDDDRRSSQHESYGSSKDRHSHHQKHRGDMLEDDGYNDKELNKRGDRDRRQRESSRGSVRSYTERSKYDDYGHTRNHGAGRRYGYDADGEKKHRHRSSSPSDDKFHHRAAFQSESPHRKSKRTSGFDMAPPVAIDSTSSSEQLSGAFATTQTRMMPNIVSGTTQVNMFGPVSLFPNLSMTQQATRHARRVYVGGLPPLANEDTISKFFSFVMGAVGGNAAGPGDAVMNVYINHEKKFAFVEMRTVEEASNAMALDGIVFEGLSVRVRRPTDYNISLAAALGPCQPSPLLNLAAVGLTSGTGEAHGPDRIFVGGVPYYFTEVQMKELLEAFGPLRGCDLVKDRETGNSKGYGFCVFEDPSVTDIACASLNGLKLGDKTLTVRRATVSGQSKPEQYYILNQTQQHITIQKSLVAAVTNHPNEGIESPTKILCLSEAVTTDELMDDAEYKEILEDMREECQKFGELVNIIIPRPAPEAAPIEGIGKVFLEYRDTVGSAKAKCALSGRKFGGNTVTALYYPEDKYFERNYAAA